MPTANQFEVVLQPTECSGLSVLGSAALIRQDPEHHRSSGDECPKNRREVRLPLTFHFRDYELVHRAQEATSTIGVVTMASTIMLLLG